MLAVLEKAMVSRARTLLVLSLSVGLLLSGAPVQAQSQIQNTATIALDPDGDMIDSNPANNQDTVLVDVIPSPEVSFNKSADPSDAVSVGDTVTFTVEVTVAQAPLSEDFILTDTLGTGLEFDSLVSISPEFSGCTNSEPHRCTLPAGTGIGTYTIVYTALVTEDANTQVENIITGEGGGDDDPQCDADCDNIIPVNPDITYNKVPDPPGPVAVGDTITYTITVNVLHGPLTEDATINDTPGLGLVFDAFVAPTDPFINCTGGATIQCTLPSGTPQGSYTLTFTATVAPSAGEVVSNAVVVDGGGDDDPTCDGVCDPEVLVSRPRVTYNKVADTTGPVNVGDEITYTINVTVLNSPLTEELTATDTVGLGITFDNFLAPTDPFTCAPPVPPEGETTFVCTLPAGTEPGTYSFQYAGTVNADASGFVSNAVVVEGGGDDDPICNADCDPDVPVDVPLVTYSKTASPDQVQVGDTVTYTLTTTIHHASITEDVVVTDTLGPGLDFGAIVDPTDPEYTNCTVSGQQIMCTVPAGTAPDSYTLTFTATVNDQAGDIVVNTLAEEGGGGAGPDCDGTCNDDTPVIKPEITYDKQADTAGPVSVGDTITYTLIVNVDDATTFEDLVLTDTLGTGLTFDAFVEPTDPFTCGQAGDSVTCTLPAGAEPASSPFTLSYTATLNDQAQGQVENLLIAEGGGDEDPQCLSDCNPVIPTGNPEVTYSKVASPDRVEVGDTVTFEVTVDIATAAITEDLQVMDTLSPGLDSPQLVEANPVYQCAVGAPLFCAIPAGTPPGSYAITYTAVVTEDAGDTVGNSVVAEGGGGEAPSCEGDCDPVIPVVRPGVTFNKEADVSQADVGDTITYTIGVNVQDAALVEDVVVTDQLGPGLAFDAFVEPTDPFICVAGNPFQCTLPAQTQPGSYEFSYTATVTDEAEGEVQNLAVADGGGGGDPVCETECDPVIPLRPSVQYNKTPSVSETSVGDTINYTLEVTVTNAPLAEDLVLTDTPGTGLELEAFIEPTDPFTCTGGDPLQCVLPAGTQQGNYRVIYTATVTGEAEGQVENLVVAEGGGGGDPSCLQDCDPVIPVVGPMVTYNKSTDTTEAAVGDVITYTITATVEEAPLSEELVLTDIPGDGLAFIEVTDAGAYDCNDESPLVCTLPPGTQQGSYPLSLTMEVTADAADEVQNLVIAEGGGDDNPTCEDSCDPVVPLVDPQVTVTKSANPVSGSEVAVGDTITYTLDVQVEQSALTEDLLLSDTPSGGLTFDELPDGCTMLDDEITCVLSAGTAAGNYSFSYNATVNAEAGNTVNNQVVPAGGGDDSPDCPSCETSHEIQAPDIRIVKTANTSEVVIGDIVVYTIVAENIGGRDLQNGVLVDTPPPGFSYVEGTLSVDDGDDSGVLLNENPLTVGEIDIAAGDSAVITYGMRVGAAVRPGVHRNQAVMRDEDGRDISNDASAEVVLVADPLLDESLIFGKVFNDLNGNGAQDSATLTGVRARGGFYASAYVPDSTTVNGVPVADASAPLLRGLDLGSLPGLRNGQDDPEPIVISQRLTSPDFTDDFALTSSEGYTLRMDGDGNTRVEYEGGRNGAALYVRRSLIQVDGDYRVDYVIGNRGMEEMGVPGVRIASVEGLLMETDQFGRYHLVGVDGGFWERGRNFILKVDPATLPEGTVFTTRNPLIRRITPGLPVRFDFGVRMPVQRLEADRNSGRGEWK